MDPYQPIFNFLEDLKTFSSEVSVFLVKTLHLQFIRLEEHKGTVAWALYRQRGKLARRLTHSGIVSLAALGVMIAPVIAKEFPGRTINPWQVSQDEVQSMDLFGDDSGIDTQVTVEHDGIFEYVVQPGDTVSTIGQKFGVTQDTIRWQNNLQSVNAIKVGQTLQILPITGVAHKVKKGDTVESIAKYYDAESQAIIDYPFNTFVNDETFELAIGETLIVPDGVKPQEVLWQPVARGRQTTPNAGTVTASGSFVWPTQGIITQNFAWYHKGIDIANRAAPNVLAADAGTVVAAGWDSTGYGNKVMIDHGNGYKTLYGHMQKLFVVVGQTVRRGDAVGQMGSTGRSTGTHLHFEVRTSGGNINPLTVLK